MTFDETKAKADSFFEFPTDNRYTVTTTSAILFAMVCVRDKMSEIEKMVTYRKFASNQDMRESI